MVVTAQGGAPGQIRPLGSVSCLLPQPQLPVCQVCQGFRTSQRVACSGSCTLIASAASFPRPPIHLASSCLTSREHSRLGKFMHVLQALAHRVTLMCHIPLPFCLHACASQDIHLQPGMPCPFWIEWMILTLPCRIQKSITYSASN